MNLEQTETPVKCVVEAKFPELIDMSHTTILECQLDA